MWNRTFFNLIFRAGRGETINIFEICGLLLVCCCCNEFFCRFDKITKSKPTGKQSTDLNVRTTTFGTFVVIFEFNFSYLQSHTDCTWKRIRMHFSKTEINWIRTFQYFHNTVRSIAKLNKRKPRNFDSNGID